MALPAPNLHRLAPMKKTSAKCQFSMVVGATLLGACTLNLAKPGGIQIQCSKDSDCSGHLSCDQLLGLCVAQKDVTPPSLVSAQPVSPTGVNLTFSEPIS